MSPSILHTMGVQNCLLNSIHFILANLLLSYSEKKKSSNGLSQKGSNFSSCMMDVEALHCPWKWFSYCNSSKKMRANFYPILLYQLENELGSRVISIVVINIKT